ncbi:chromosome segregation protein SMC [Actinocorallia sp. A-T 12471]|uniref:chromosome segregation protein SMC n=1 Tax=Actinocorallia sp. A-T 12471 TaxID=3089813 RepID=UPI0029CD04E7|nr:chromosome segregation protein SMC [Actinocorallia sp. A-T 12471]MDX6739105.1 chromosome segregation protein SMC [Actinocorallia sp. A-T 12471]
MYLKSLTLRGFKSFASSTTLRFEPGITCVVGPNGSGKSNVVDALAWVMGEQGAKSLRGGKMEDVIFAGTANRAPLGRAEVVLTIDNSDGALPIDYSEVTISRLMFRSGSSEYSINGDGCRLLDVQELLSDSGIGREMHVIIGQGQLDQVLNAGPEGRRAIVEEAAGVLKHRKRKEKALRKLDAMQANLTRVQDLTAELRRQLKPLGKQAEIARRAAVIQAELRDAKLRLLADDLVTLSAKIEREAADEESVRRRRAEVEAALATAQTREEQLDAEAAEAAPVLAAVQETWFRLSSLKERLRGVADLAAERHRGATGFQDEERFGRDPEDLEREAEEARAQEEVLAERLEEAQGALDEAVAERAGAESALAAEDRRIQQLARAAAERRESLARQRSALDALRSRLQAAGAEIGRLTEARLAAEDRAEAALAEAAAFQSEIEADPALAAELELAEAALAEAKDGAAAAREGVAGPRGALKAAREQIGAARAADQRAQKEVTALQARIEALELGLGSAADGGEELLSSGIAGVEGTLAASLTVRPGAEAAIAAVLGALTEAITVTSLDAAAHALAFLGERGAAAGLVIGSAPKVPGSGQACPSGGVWAAELVTVPESLRPALDRLLEGVVVVEDPALAREIVAASPALRAVTRDGRLLGAHWARAGSSSGQGPLQMRASLDEAVADLTRAREAAELSAAALEEASEAEAEAQLAVEEAQALATAAEAAVGRAQSDLDGVRARLREADAAAAQEAKQEARLQAAAQAARQEAERLAGNVRDAEDNRDATAERLAEMEERYAVEAEAEPEEEPDTEIREELAERVTELRGAEMEARLAVRTAEERAGALAGRADALERQAEQERRSRAQAVERRRRRQQQARIALAVQEGARTALARIGVSLEIAIAEREEAERRRAAREEELKVVRGQVREYATQLERLVNVVHGSEVARAEQRLRLERLQEKALEEYGMEVEGLVAEYGPDQPVPPQDPEAAPEPFDRAVQEKRAKAAERQMAQLGKVNPLALEEFAALEERHAFLTSQLEDLKKTRKDLFDIVKDVDQRVQEVFAAAYAETAEHFEGIFSRLFPGGEGSLSLTDPEDMLTTGIEVAARPPGKKVKRLSLLSGGERSLVAIAFLVAVFKARPSPFYVLDEVEAALDDTNTQRLIGVFEELRESSQLIVITHQKRTMEGADALYGVSMRGDGVSQVISQRLREAEPA